MNLCKICNKKELFSLFFSNVCLCRNCANLIRLSEWEDRIFDSIDDLIGTKNKILSIISSNPNMIQIKKSVEDYFDEYINKGFVASLDGKAGQKLLIFNEYCIVNTKKKSQRDELVIRFNDYIDLDFYDDINNNDDNYDELKKISNIVNFNKGLMKGGIVTSGISMVADLVMSEMKEEKILEKKYEKKREITKKKAKEIICVGDRLLNLNKYSRVETYFKSNNSYGYMQFVPKDKNSNDMFDCDYFFFNPGVFGLNKNLKNRIEIIKNILNKMISSLPSSVTIKNNETHEDIITKDRTVDNFAEIRKYKELLDEGIITEDEFNQKKKKLLNL